MGASTTIRRIVHAATTAPRLWSAAMRAGVGPAGAVQVLRISAGALRTSTAHGTGVPGRANAMRHFMWQALLTAHFGRSAAVSIARSQEEGTPALADSRVDEHNNRAGQDHGEAHAEELASRPVGEALDALVPVALAKWESDELIWVRPQADG